MAGVRALREGELLRDAPAPCATPADADEVRSKVVAIVNAANRYNQLSPCVREEVASADVPSCGGGGMRGGTGSATEFGLAGVALLLRRRRS